MSTIPEGYWLAPIKLTADMHDAAEASARSRARVSVSWPMVWEALQKAAPIPPAARASPKMSMGAYPSVGRGPMIDATALEHQIKAVEDHAASTLWTGSGLLKGLIAMVRMMFDKGEGDGRKS